MSEAQDRISRRGLLKLGAAGAAALCATGRLALGAAAEAGGKKIPIGLQLYSVRTDCAKDLPATVEAVAKMGYQGVEFAGYCGRSAQDLRKLLDDNGLKCCGTHTGIDTILGDKLKATIEFNKALGNPFLMVPSLPPKYQGTREKWLETAKLFNEAAEKAKPEGMYVGYHNHSVEFKAIDGELPWDIFFGNTTKDVCMQLDIGNCMGGGGDPLTFLKKYGDRALTVHLKEFGRTKEQACVGDGLAPWKAIFELCEATGATQWYIVEQGSYPTTPLESVKRCLDNLRTMGK